MSEFTLLLVVALIFAVIQLYLRLKDANQRIGDLANRLNLLETEERRQRHQAAATEREAQRTPPPAVTPRSERPAPIADLGPVIPPPLPAMAPSRSTPLAPLEPAPSFVTDLPQAPAPAAKKVEAAEKPLLPPFTLEAFMGVKLFAWLGGLALFLGVIFLIRYSFEHNLITPAMRVTLGGLTGLGLIAGGLFMPRPKFAVTAQTLCATGVVVLYGVTYSAHALYQFFGLMPAFGLMTAITAGAFLLAILLEAQVVAILGLLAGFLTPIILSTGQDNPVALFTYLAVLDAGLMAVALRQRWPHLVTLAAGATALMQLAWFAEYFAPSKLGVATAIFLGFEALFLLPFWRCNREEDGESWTTGAAGLMAATALGFAAALLGWPELGTQPWLVLSILLLADAGLVAWPLRRTALQGAPMIGGVFVFLVLCAWNARYLRNNLLGWALGFFLLFAAFHTALPIVLRRLRPAAATPRWAQIFPGLALVLMLWPALEIGASTLLWGAVLLADLAAIALAAFTASLLGVVAALVLTLVAVGLWLAQTPVENPSLTGLLVVIAGFAALFCAASVFLQRRLAATGLASTAAGYEREALQHLPAISAVLPFLLLISVVERLHPLNPSPIFGVGLLLIVILLALARWSDTLALPPIALICGVLLEYFWHIDHRSVLGGLPLAWYLGFAAVISAFPFLFQPRSSPRVTPWATARARARATLSAFSERPPPPPGRLSTRPRPA